MSEFGPIIDYARVENAIRDQVIRAWIDTYLIAVERENDLPPRTIKRPRDWKILDDLTTTPEKNLPVFYVVSAGDTDAPSSDGENGLSGSLAMGVIVAVKDTNRDTTRIVARRYGAAIAALVGHKLGTADLGMGLASEPRQAFDERLATPNPRTTYVMGLAYVTFDIQVDLIRYRYGGPDDPFPAPQPGTDPPPNPSDPAHTATNVTVTPAEDLT